MYKVNTKAVPIGNIDIWPEFLIILFLFLKLNFFLVLKIRPTTRVFGRTGTEGRRVETNPLILSYTQHVKVSHSSSCIENICYYHRKKMLKVGSKWVNRILISATSNEDRIILCILSDTYLLFDSFGKFDRK